MAGRGGLQVSSAEAQALGGPSGTLALGLWLAALAPQWILLLWGVKRLGWLQKLVARAFGWKMLAAGCWAAAALVAFLGTVSVCRDVLGSERLEMQRIIANGTLVQEGLLIVVGLVLVRRRRAPSSGGDSPRRG